MMKQNLLVYVRDIDAGHGQEVIFRVPPETPGARGPWAGVAYADQGEYTNTINFYSRLPRGAKPRRGSTAELLYEDALIRLRRRTETDES